MRSDPITSPTNPQIKHLVRLRNRRNRDATGQFVIEGYRELRRAIDGGTALDTLYVSPELWIGSNEAQLVEDAAEAGAEVIEVAAEPFRKASYRDRPEGLLATAPQFDTSIDVLPAVGPATLWLVAEAIEKPGNLGTMLRTAEAAGADGVIVADATTDPFNPNVVRASLGALFALPLAIVSTPAAIALCRDQGVAIVAATPDGAVPHFEVDLRGPSALVVGSEQFGLSPAWLEAATHRAAIPMPGSMDSLNAALSAGIILFEAVRQRMSPR